MNARTITVTQPLEIQRHVLKIAGEKTDKEILDVIKSLQNNKAQKSTAKNGEYLKVWNAYANGWRGNFIDSEPRINDVAKAVIGKVSVAIKSKPSPTESKPYEKPSDIDVASKFMSLNSNAISRSKEFSLTLIDVRRLLTKKRCEYTGIELTKATSSPPNDTDRTIDRLDSDIGYIPGNVFAVSHKANSLKNVFFEKDSENKTTVELMHEMTSRIIKLKSGSGEE